MIAYRNISAMLCTGDIDSAEMQKPVFQFFDVPDRLKLLIGEGKASTNYFALVGISSVTLQLPQNYDTTKKLACFIASNSLVKTVVASPAHTTSTTMLKGTADNLGLMFWNERITSIVVSNADAAATALVKICLYELPDVSLSASYLGGAYSLGRVAE